MQSPRTSDILRRTNPHLFSSSRPPPRPRHPRTTRLVAPTAPNYPDDIAHSGTSEAAVMLLLLELEYQLRVKDVEFQEQVKRAMDDALAAAARQIEEEVEEVAEKAAAAAVRQVEIAAAKEAEKMVMKAAEQNAALVAATRRANEEADEDAKQAAVASAAAGVVILTIFAVHIFGPK
ncbi:hypothetical protein FA95DRAFT_1610373 [Auriscalpium vulgare]|uniref:Uncharacterized protein n=1 Tax=Auriscalpium vulgare TaxID=40419 RepID=A0ACB8REC0_9AGAM|nr:hypothetical protein FA95DRAFT_1610373 [Auriscalpium vulgare]